jgi:hypothetical protein
MEDSEFPVPPPLTATSCPASPRARQCPQPAQTTLNTRSILVFALCALNQAPIHIGRVSVSPRENSVSQGCRHGAGGTATGAAGVESRRSSSTTDAIATSGSSMTLALRMRFRRGSRGFSGKTTATRTGTRTGRSRETTQIEKDGRNKRNSVVTSEIGTGQILEELERDQPRYGTRETYMRNQFTHYHSLGLLPNTFICR